MRISGFNNASSALATIGLVTFFFAAVSADASLIGHWTLDEGTGITAADSSAFGNDATLTGAQNWVTGVSGTGFEFPGGGGTRFGVTMGAELPVGASERTILAWINPDSNGDRKFLGYGSGAGSTFNFTVEGSGVRFRHGGGNITYGGGIPINTTAFTHVAMRVPVGASLTGDLDVFINGMEATVTGTGGGGAGVTLNTTAGEFRIGNSGSNSFDGALDDVQFYDNALSDADILRLFNNPGQSLDALNAIVPEPSTAMVLLGLLGATIARRKRRSVNCC